MSKKYIESMNKITVDNKLKKRILGKVSQVSEQENNNITVLKKKRINKLGKKSISIAAACCAFVVFAGVKSEFPELFNVNDVTISVDNEELQDNNLQVNDSNIVENDNQDQLDNNYINDNDVSITNDYLDRERLVDSNNIGKENKSEENTTKSNESQIYNSEKSADNLSYMNIINKENKENKQSKRDSSNNEIKNDYEDSIFNNNQPSALLEDNNGKDYLQNEMAENVVSETDSRDDISSSKRTIEKSQKNIKNILKVPEGLKNNYEIIYTVVVSDNQIKVGYKDEKYENGEISISSEKNTNNVESYSSVENVKTSKGTVVIKISENGKEKYVDWEYENIYYTLYTKGNVDDETIIHIIESCI